MTMELTFEKCYQYTAVYPTAHTSRDRHCTLSNTASNSVHGVRDSVERERDGLHYIIVQMYDVMHLYEGFHCISHCSYISRSPLHSIKHPHRRRRSHLKQVRLPKFPTSFYGNPLTCQTRYHGSPQNFKQIFA